MQQEAADPQDAQLEASEDDPGPVGIDAVYQNLVPDQYRKELKNVGVMGGISFDGLALRHFLFILATPQML
ncbi:hypothetical protein MW887_008441 [Aspergillus wentii]|nr:hypothetical protein MW887_008441 [Aspergillus wentii]